MHLEVYAMSVKVLLWKLSSLVLNVSVAITMIIRESSKARSVGRDNLCYTPGFIVGKTWQLFMNTSQQQTSNNAVGSRVAAAKLNVHMEQVLWTASAVFPGQAAWWSCLLLQMGSQRDEEIVVLRRRERGP